MMKFAFKYFGYRFRQYRRKTNEKIVVETEYGPVKGVKRISCWNDPFYSFERIPFAKPPLGELRFREPQTPDSWTEPINCTSEGDGPLQLNSLQLNSAMGSEDCLYLNVYTKNVKPNKPLPVMVWIHGGGFILGSTSKDMAAPDHLMMKDVVVVSLAYRLGALGFLSLKDPSLNIPGNAGLKDQVLGLKWVKNNIAQFGGDPNNITIFGVSAGGASAHYMCITDQTKGLFHKAIFLSGTSLAPWAMLPDRNFPYRLVQKMGYTDENDEAKILKFLRNANATNITVANMNILNDEEKLDHVLFPSAPVIEPYITDHCVVPKDPRLMAREAWTNDIPIIMGGTSFEGILSYFLELREDKSFLEKFGECRCFVPLDLNLDRYGELCKEYGLRLKKHHFGDEKPSVHSYLNLSSYKLFWHGIHRTLLSRLKYAKAPTYLYRFDAIIPGLNFFTEFFLNNEIEGVSHGDDMGYLFLNMFTSEVNKNSKGFQVINQYVSFFTHFAATDNPNYPEMESIEWKPVESNGNPVKCLNISSDGLTFINLPEAKSLEVWDSLYSEDTLI